MMSTFMHHIIFLNISRKIIITKIISYRITNRCIKNIKYIIFQLCCFLMKLQKSKKLCVFFIFYETKFVVQFVEYRYAEI